MKTQIQKNIELAVTNGKGYHDNSYISKKELYRSAKLDVLPLVESVPMGLKNYFK